MNENKSGYELRDASDVKASIARCQEFVERVCLGVLSDCEAESRIVSKKVMEDSLFSAFQSWATSPAAAPVLGMSGEVSAVFLATHESQFRARFQPAIDRAYANWERANSVNGGMAN
jgi:hypothetical protein